MPTLSDDITLWATIVGLIMGFSIYMDSVTTQGVKDVVRSILASKDNPLKKFLIKCPELFIGAFDSFFGENHLSRKCFFRSSLASIITILIIGFVLRNHSSFNPFSKDMFSSDIAGIAYVMFLLILSIILNVIPDYISLLETRYIIFYTINKNSITYICLIILLDFFASAILYIIIAGLLSYITLSFMQANLLKYYSNIYNYMYHFASMCLGGGYTIFFLSTYFTSLWIYILLVFSIIIKIITKLNIFSIRIAKYFVVNEKPFQFIGFILVIIFTFILILYKLVLFLLLII